MSRYLAIVSYDGSNYHGFQKQANAHGIQDVIEYGYRLMSQHEITIHSAGRTDKGVHALGQAFHFDSDLKMDEDILREAWNRRLPNDIIIKSIQPVADSFHARYDAKGKKYSYYIAKSADIRTQRFASTIPNFNFSRLREAPNYLIGVHDFKGFCKYTLGKETIREITDLKLIETKNYYKITIKGKSFLRYMVRSIVGTLIEIASEKKEIDVIDEILKTQNRKLAGKTAEAKGLFLEKVYY